MKGGVRNNSDDMPLQGGHTSVAPIADTDMNASSQVPTNGSDTNCIPPAANLTSWDNPVDYDSLMRKAYGATLIQSGSCSNTDWHPALEICCSPFRESLCITRWSCWQKVC